MLQARAPWRSRRKAAIRFAEMGSPHIVVQLIDTAIVVAVSSQSIPCLAAQVAPHDIIGCVHRTVAVVVARQLGKFSYSNSKIIVWIRRPDISCRGRR